MSGPYFETWERENLVLFAREVYEKLQRQEEELQVLRGDPGNRYAHRLAIELECALLAPKQANAGLLDEYHTAVRKWMEANGQPYVSGFGKD
jgi:hypothetical protein